MKKKLLISGLVLIGVAILSVGVVIFLWRFGPIPEHITHGIEYDVACQERGFSQEECIIGEKTSITYPDGSTQEITDPEAIAANQADVQERLESYDKTINIVLVIALVSLILGILALVLSVRIGRKQRQKQEQQ